MLKATTDDFVAVWQRLRSPAKVAQHFKMRVEAVHARRRRVELKLGIKLPVDREGLRGLVGPNAERSQRRDADAERRHTSTEYTATDTVRDGTVIVFNDAHYWPNLVTEAHKALVRLARKLKPEIIVANGDVLDGAAISRHPRMGWESRPTVKQEIETVCTRMKEVELAAPRARLVRTIGNHDLRFESYLSANAPEIEGLHGTLLVDYLPKWRPCWALHINAEADGWTVIRHVHVAGGIHSAYNSTVRAGTHYVHGHLHKLNITPFGDYRGRRYGVDAGTLADPDGPQFRYTQGGPLNWCSGFVVLTYRDGRLLMPEVCEVLGGTAYFRGERA